MKRLLAFANILNLLLIFVPIAIVLEFTHASPMLIFVASCLAIIPLAGLMGKATENLAEKAGRGHRRPAQRHVRQRRRADHRARGAAGAGSTTS